MNIFVNGASYTSWEQVPPEVRQQLAATLPDADRNAIPDLFEGNLAGLPSGTSTSTAISVNGQNVDSMAALPPEVQALMRQAFGWPAQPATTTPPQSPQSPQSPQVGATPPLQPGQVLLNGVPTTADAAATGEKKSWWRRLLGS